jgi:phosphatidylserine decarboxylase
VFAPRSGRYLAAGAVFLLLLGVSAFFAPSGSGLRIVIAGAFASALALLLFLGWFFRDPTRETGEGIVSAADGKVQDVTTEGDRIRIAVFMNVTDVHVNRFPLDAEVRSIEDAGEGFRPAYAPEANHNLRRHYVLSTTLGEVEIVQMTGILARRLVSLVHPGERRRKGERLGMIILGSRVDVLLPGSRVEALVRRGDRVVAGVTPIARERS